MRKYERSWHFCKNHRYHLDTLDLQMSILSLWEKQMVDLIESYNHKIKQYLKEKTNGIYK